MFIPSSVKIFLCDRPTDMRKSHNGLSSLVRTRFPEKLSSGHLFVFYNKRRDRIKVLFYHHGGLALFYKRLERGKFRLPQRLEDKTLELSNHDLSIILAGLDPSQLRPQKLWLPVLT